MSEVDIWMNVIQRLGYEIIDEYSGIGKYNYIIYGKDENKFYLYFNRESELVSSIRLLTKDGYFDESKTIKEVFYQTNKSLFREIKINSLIFNI